MSLWSSRLLSAALCMAAVSTIGCPAKELPPTDGGAGADKRSPADKPAPANDLLLDLSKEKDGVVAVTTGTEHFGKGLVILSVYGSGKVEITNRRAGKITRYEASLTTDEVRRLGTDFAKAGFTSAKTSGPPRSPGDTPVVLELGRSGEPLFRRELWNGDRYQQPGLDAILKRNDAIVKDATKGELPY